MIDKMHQIESLFGTKLPTVFVVLAAVMMTIVMVLAFLPRFSRNAVWKGTNVPISVASRASGFAVGWLAFILIVAIHPLALLAVLPLGFLSASMALRKDKERFARTKPSNATSEPAPGAGSSAVQG